MNSKELDYLLYIATLDLNAYDYKILLLLMEKPYNQAALAEILGVMKQHIYKCVKRLEAQKLIEVDRVEGRNKFYKLVTNLEQLNQIIPGQIKVTL